MIVHTNDFETAFKEMCIDMVSEFKLLVKKYIVTSPFALSTNNPIRP